MAQTASGRGGLGVFGTLLSVGLLVALFIFFAQSTAGGSSGGSQLAPASVLGPVTSVSRPVLGAVATGGLANPFRATPADTAILTGPGGKPVVLFVGAEFCPYCAAERWSIVVALSRFGAFTNLHLVQSSHLDVFPDTSSFTFYGGRYSSPYVDFVAVEERSNQPDSTGYKSLQTPTTEQQHIYDTYDRSPYAQQSGIPFLDVGNRYIAVSSGYSPQVLQGQSWQAIAAALSDPNAPTTRAIVGNANYITAAVCRVTRGAPASVCDGPMISRLAASMP